MNLSRRQFLNGLLGVGAGAVVGRVVFAPALPSGEWGTWRGLDIIKSPQLPPGLTIEKIKKARALFDAADVPSEGRQMHPELSLEALKQFELNVKRAYRHRRFMR